ncbi:MAG: hypothetical protein U0X39_02200 [Bacteroidales bacterium]
MGILRLKTMSRFENLTLLAVILLSWGIALFEYFSRYLQTG